MALDGYMYFEKEGNFKNKDGVVKGTGKIKGEAQDFIAAKVGAFEVDTFAWGVEAGTSHSDNPLATAANVKTFTVTKEVDYATPSLFNACANRAVFPIVHVYFRKSSGQYLQKFLRFKFTELMIESWNLSFDASGTYTETLVCGFGWCQIRYEPQTKAGAKRKDPDNVKDFNIVKPTETSTPSVAQGSAPDESAESSDASSG